ncbi:hypothetical protein [Beijerinckia mobilis]|uniref:hypothetical protein n=1 Tax=Beijerinckia mobilis TaxID=231434 RepID=UPI000AA464FC|nr:hypothetical protein [Beijerinckia mobilis]
MLRKMIVSTLAAAGLMTSIVAAPALPFADREISGQGTESLPVETVQFFWGGRNYCWYPGGWQGPGWYWCGYAWRRGIGWGGPRGWRGWGVPGPGRPGWGGHPPPPRGWHGGHGGRVQGGGNHWGVYHGGGGGGHHGGGGRPPGGGGGGPRGR